MSVAIASPWTLTRRAASSPGTTFVIGVAIPITLFLILQLFNDPSAFFRSSVQSIALGSVYALLALGFVLIFKASQVINFSLGAIAVSGALFLSFLVADGHIPFTTIRNPILDLPLPNSILWFLSLLLALTMAALLGLLIERIAIRPMVGKPVFAVAVITLGLEVVLRVFATDATKTQFRALDAPWGNSTFRLFGATLDWAYVAVISTAVIAFVVVNRFYQTRTGVSMRAVAHDQEAAMAQGINVGRLFAIAWAAGAVLATLGGIFSTQPPMKQIGAVEPGTDLVALRALPAVILGGLDSVRGALIGGLVIGAAEVYAGEYLAGEASWLGPGYSLIVPYVVMTIGLLVRPYGMFGTPEVRRV